MKRGVNMMCFSFQLSELVLSALNQNLVQFTLRPGVQVTVYAAHLSAGNELESNTVVLNVQLVGIVHPKMKIDNHFRY